jgi:hypothetical protein
LIRYLAKSCGGLGKDGGAMELISMIVYLGIGFIIARFMKDDPRSTSTGMERLGWFLFWPYLYVWKFICWVINTFED